MNVIRKIDSLLNGLTMYRLVLYALALLAGTAILLSGLGTLDYSVTSLVGSVVLLTGLCFGLNVLLARLYDTPTNHESSLITGLLLFFIIVPPTTQADWLALVVAATAAIASKYVITWRRANILNPAAVGALILSLTHLGSAGWWVAAKPLFVFCLLAGLIIVRKQRRFSMFLVFATFATLLNVYWLTRHGAHLGGVLTTVTMSYPILFLGSFMLTEPGTMPASGRNRLIFAALVGLLFASHVRLGTLSATPHLALIIGNIFAAIVSYRAAVSLQFIGKVELAPNIYNFAFKPLSPLAFKAGQYMEWTLPGVKLDSRGNRRTFTIASSPREDYVHLGLKVYEPGSAYKTALLHLKAGDIMLASHIAGDFIMPADPAKKLVFIAGGVGITPFRSMVAERVLQQQPSDIVLFYLAANGAEVVYKDIWQSAEPFGIRLVTITGEAHLDAALLKDCVPETTDREFYISGPPPMVVAYKQFLRQVGIAATHIHVDSFSGY